jgi:hypothetical protein
MPPRPRPASERFIRNVSTWSWRCGWTIHPATLRLQEGYAGGQTMSSPVPSGHVHARRWRSWRFREALHELRVVDPLLAAQAVIEVGHLETDSQGVAHGEEHVDERNRIRTPRDGDEERVLGAGGTNGFKEFEDPCFEHGFALPERT